MISSGAPGQSKINPGLNILANVVLGAISTAKTQVLRRVQEEVSGQCAVDLERGTQTSQQESKEISEEVGGASGENKPLIVCR